MLNKYALIKVVKGVIRENNEFSLRDTARKLKISPSTSKSALDFLLSQKILEKREIGKNYLFKVKNTYITRQIKELYTLAELNSANFVEEVIAKCPDVLSIALYGSAAKGEDDNNSDIDILIISRKNIDIPELNSERKINREVTIVSYTYKEWKEKTENDKVFYSNVILNCIPLHGEKPVVL